MSSLGDDGEIEKQSAAANMQVHTSKVCRNVWRGRLRESPRVSDGGQTSNCGGASGWDGTLIKRPLLIRGSLIDAAELPR